ncbi:MAG: hypothetical protein ACYC2D_05725 [Thiobacillus sp.]
MRWISSLVGCPESQPIEFLAEGERPPAVKKRLKNATFKTGSPSALNACVGENGNPGAIDYARGYASAATLLLDMVIADWVNAYGKNFHADEFVYPISFNMRHAVELHLKEAAARLISLSEHRLPLADIDLKATHDLFKLWTFLTESAPHIDRRLQPILLSMDEYVVDIAEVDATGQVFRYPFDTESKKHLVEVAIINLVVLRDRFRQLKELLEKLFRLNEELQREYRLGTFTKSLSRHDLSVIAERLPERRRWAEDVFTAARAGIRRDYTLGSRECSDAFDLIQGNYQLASKIGIELSLAYLREHDLFAFLDAWCRQHELESYKAALDPSVKIDLNSKELSFEQIVDSHKELGPAIENLAKALTIRKLSEIDALYYFASDTRYSEEFVEIRDQYLRRYEVTNEFSHGIQHMLEKTGAMTYLLQSLQALGQRTLVSAIAARYGLKNHLQYILKTSPTGGGW